MFYLSYILTSYLITGNAPVGDIRNQISSLHNFLIISIICSTEEIQIYIPTEPRYSFDQLIIPEDLKKEIEEALGLLKYQYLIYKVWGFEKVDPIPKSVLNFYGPPGTGKTMCAHTIAKTLGKKSIRFKLLHFPVNAYI